MIRAFCFLALFSAAPVAAETIQLIQPVACTLGQDCYIQQYTDHDDSPGARDFTCGSLAYDGHKGTDFALLSMTDMHKGVDVRAAAGGKVVAVRNGMDDTGLTPDTESTLKGKECGNGVLLDHGNGWETQYCHLKKGSVTVKGGQQIKAGTKLGQIGFSGRTEFPHLHLSVRHGGAVIDPFAPTPTAACAKDGPSLWANPLPYQPGGLLEIGFAPEVPDFETYQTDRQDIPTFAQDSPALVLFGYGFGSRAGDKMRFTLSGPDGEILNHTTTLKKTQALFIQAAGKRRWLKDWPSGRYEGEVTLLRKGQQISRRLVNVSLP